MGSGSSARTLVPAPKWLSIVSRPCSASTRSRMLANPPERAPFDSKPRPSSSTIMESRLPECESRTRAPSVPACLATLVRDSQATK